MMKEKIIGVVGGLGPYAGIHLVKCIFDQTIASKDQDHVQVALLSYPSEIEDRTQFLIGNNRVNPGKSIARIILNLEHIGAEVVGISCNTSHAFPIMSVIEEELQKAGSNVMLLKIDDEVSRYILENYHGIKKVGLLSTIGTYRAMIYPDVLNKSGLACIVPSEKIQTDVIHEAIYNKNYGIKAFSNPLKQRVKKDLLYAIRDLKVKGAEAIILGCTELSLAFDGTNSNIPLVDSNMVLARALIREAAPHKLKQLSEITYNDPVRS